jgi:hypothetical protein
MIDLAIVVLIMLSIVSIIDFFTKKIPSALLTGMVFMVAIVNMAEVTFGMIHLAFGILAFLFAWMIYEVSFIGGMADVKIIALLGMMINSIPNFFIMIGFIMVFGFLYKLFWRFIMKKQDKEEVPFLPCLLIVYILLYTGGGII